MRFTGVSAFPFTPFLAAGAGSRAGAAAGTGAEAGMRIEPGTSTEPDCTIDEAGYARVVAHAAKSGVESLCALGSTGGAPYLSPGERTRVIELTLEHACGLPVAVGVSALSTREVLENVAEAQRLGAAAVLLAPMTYQPLTAEEVFGLYATVSAELSVPLIVYDNPTTTGFTFTSSLHGRIATLPGVASIKIPPVPEPEASTRLAEYRAQMPPGVTLGISGDASAAGALLAGCEAWYSVLAGALPVECLAIHAAASAGDATLARALSGQLTPLWRLFAEHGSYRVIAAVLAELGLISHDSLPHPVRSLDERGARAVAAALAQIAAASGSA
ncbi:dihydrodipicolinate synthase family protein [Leucobacter albus]|uniref:Dihydrodipicolinate synthase family protein n=1 Tax=Leucobacter albus TaxID=272210 RepID=A0ABW3TQQ9_9MICO